MDRLESEVPNPSEYADTYTKESIVLLSDILERPQSWFGIPISAKNLELSKLQLNLDNVARSLIKYSAQDQHSYNSSSLEVVVKKANVPTLTKYVNQNGDKIEVIANNDNDTAISFYGFSNFGCISDGRYDCSSVSNVTTSPNNGVIGASLYKNNQIQKPQKVLLTFQIQNGTLNITDRSCVFWDVVSNTWTDYGCILISAESDKTICQCDHLTNFGVIMDINGILQENVSISFKMYYSNFQTFYATFHSKV